MYEDYKDVDEGYELEKEADDLSGLYRGNFRCGFCGTPEEIEENLKNAKELPED